MTQKQVRHLLAHIGDIEKDAEKALAETKQRLEKARADLRQYCSHEWRTTDTPKLTNGEMVCDVCGAKKRV